MSQQELDLKRFLKAVRRYRLLVVGIAVLGLAAGAAFTVLRPPLFTSRALVVLPTSAAKYIETQVVIANSQPVLIGAQRAIHPPVPLTTLLATVQTKSVTTNVVGITAAARTAASAENIANAVADSYVSYLGSKNVPGGTVPARVLVHATSADRAPLASRLLLTGGLGALLGALIGTIVAVALGRTDRRLRERDEIADSIGAPVLASVYANRPSGTAGWAKLLEDYEPGVVNAWSMRQALDSLGLADGDTVGPAGGGFSLAVMSLSSDPRALALGPQFAVYAARLGVHTALIIGPQQDPNVTATLRAACAAPAAIPPRRPAGLRVAVADQEGAGRFPDAALTIVVAVVDGENPQVADTMGAGVTVLAVSAGAATAEQLARVAAGAAADGRRIAGILVADPDPADHTTGRLPQPGRAARRRLPTRLTGTSMEGER
jgi:capsular polysaccharide biosynthesis protein